MKILQVHNRYRFRGGEDVVFENTIAALRARGLDVAAFERSSNDLPAGLPGKLRAVAAGVYSPAAAREMRHCLERERPDLVHIHNLYPLLSPSILDACARSGIPVVMTCHNFRLTCPIGTHFIRGQICTQCRDHSPWRCLFRNCRDNRLESAAYALRAAAAAQFRWFQRGVSRFIAISHFLRSHLAAAGLPADRIHVVPNMCPAPAAATDPGVGEYLLFCGRLSPEKGLDTLLAAARLVPEVPLVIAGEGPLKDTLAAAAPPSVRFAGLLQRDELATLYRGARAFIAPSVWYETFGLVVAEAMGHGLPVIASRIGALPELIEDHRTGLLFTPGNAEELAQHLRACWADPDRCRRLGAAGRAKAMTEFSEARHVDRLLEIYAIAIRTGT
jgi:glycosyltransferase involved in cell wall biosynthesis